MRTLVRFGVATVAAGLALATGVLLLAPQAKAFFTAGATGAGERLNLRTLSQRSVVYAADGSVLAYLHSEEDRVPVKLDAVPPHVVKAILDVEDERFFQHGAVDVHSLLRALVTNVHAGGVREGGSTITQQLVKNGLLSPKQDLNRKLKEAILAIRLERQTTKQDILERYLNTVYFGNGAYGLQAAAERYFGKKVGDLTMSQGALLAGLIRNPVGYDPFKAPQLSRERRDFVIDRMRRLGDLTPDEADRVKAEPLPPRPVDLPQERLDYFVEEVKQQLLADSRLGDSFQERYHAVFEGGLAIHTTLDPRQQRIAEDKVRSILPDTQGQFTAALVSLDPSTGAVRALVGGPGFEQSKYNIVTAGLRQPGSSFKAFTLMTALEQGHSPFDTVDGTSPCTIPNPGGQPNPWRPENFEGEGGGVMTLVDATAHSVNCAYARLALVVGPRNIVDVAHRMGVTNDLQPVPAMTLGTEAVAPLQMASAYATLAADGEHHKPFFVESVDDRDGKTVFRAKPKGERAVSAQNARVETKVLQEVVRRGTGVKAAVPGWEVAGKTGTAEDYRDAWFVGYTTKLTTAVWMGSPTGEVPMHNVGSVGRVVGGSYPAMIWGAFMKDALAGTRPVPFPDPNERLIPGASRIGGGGPPVTGPFTTRPGGRSTDNTAPDEQPSGTEPPPRSRPTIDIEKPPPPPTVRITRPPRPEPPPTRRRRPPTTDFNFFP